MIFLKFYYSDLFYGLKNQFFFIYVFFFTLINLRLFYSCRDLRFNKIREITPGTFKGHKHIKSLLLNNNLLTSLENGIFAGLHQLRHLYLYQNRIKFIGQDVFQGLPKLEHL